MEIWDEDTGDWGLVWKSEYIYDVNGYLTAVVGYFAFDVGDWLPMEKTEREYDNDGNRTRETEYEDEGGTGEWTVSEKREYFCDAGGKDTLEMDYDWNSYTKTWQLEGKSELTYDAGRNLVQIIKYRTEGIDQPRIPMYKFEYLNDANGNDTVETAYRWEEVEEWWRQNEQIVQTYDQDGNVIFQTHGYWDDNANEWKINGKEMYEIFSTEFTKQETTYDWNDVSASWDPSIRMTHYYSDRNVTDVHFEGAAELKVYPNPTTEFVVISGLKIFNAATIEIFDMQGRTVLSQAVGQNQKVCVQHLQKGVYIYKFFVSDKTYTGKLIIK